MPGLYSHVTSHSNILQGADNIWWSCILLGVTLTAPACCLQVLDREKIRQTVISQLMPLRRHSSDQERGRPQVTLRQQLQVSACACVA